LPGDDAAVCLKPFAREYADILRTWYHRLAQDPALNPFTPRRKDIEEYIAKKLADRENSTYIICVGGAETPIGELKILRSGNTSTIAIHIMEPSYQGKGLGARAIRLAVENELAREPNVTIELKVDPGNSAALKCYEKVGFREARTVTKEGKVLKIMRLSVS